MRELGIDVMVLIIFMGGRAHGVTMVPTLPNCEHDPDQSISRLVRSDPSTTFVRMHIIYRQLSLNSMPIITFCEPAHRKGGETVRAPVNEYRAHGRLPYRGREEEPRDGKAGKNVTFDS